MRLLGYVRVSSEKQGAHGHSLDDQPERLRAYCAAYGYELVDVISEQVSARKVPLDQRPGGKELLDRLAAGEADGAIVIKLDRLFRNLLDGLDYFRDALYPRRGRAGRAGPQVVSLSEHIDTSTAAGRHMLKFALLEADAEADRTSERTAHAMEGLRRRGRKFGHVPFGCVEDGGRWDEAKSRMVGRELFRDPVLWPVREHIVRLRLEQRKSLRAISAQLFAEGIGAPTGGQKWAIRSILDLVETHASLAHLPLHTAQPDAPAAAAPDTADSAGEGA